MLVAGCEDHYSGVTQQLGRQYGAIIVRQHKAIRDKGRNGAS
jgi:hypothetical protein